MPVETSAKRSQIDGLTMRTTTAATTKTMMMMMTMTITLMEEEEEDDDDDDDYKLMIIIQLVVEFVVSAISVLHFFKVCSLGLRNKLI